jgi:hypothetical protein
MELNEDQALALLLLRRRQEEDKKREYWVHPINQERERLGDYFNLVQELRLFPDRFFNYFRMNEECFNLILSRIEGRFVVFYFLLSLI